MSQIYADKLRFRFPYGVCVSFQRGRTCGFITFSVLDEILNIQTSNFLDYSYRQLSNNYQCQCWPRGTQRGDNYPISALNSRLVVHSNAVREPLPPTSPRAAHPLSNGPEGSARGK